MRKVVSKIMILLVALALTFTTACGNLSYKWIGELFTESSSAETEQSSEADTETESKEDTSGELIYSGGDGTCYELKSHAGIKLTDLDDEIFDEDTYNADIESIEKSLTDGTSDDELQSALSNLFDEYDCLSTEIALVSRKFYNDSSDSEITERYENLESISLDCSDRTYELLSEVANSDKADVLKEWCSDEDIEELKDYTPMTSEEKEWINNFYSLSNQYDTLTADIPSQGTSAWNSWKQQVGEIYLDIVENLNNYAISRGYDNYIDYAYENEYGRDFTPEDIAELRSSIKLFGSTLLNNVTYYAIDNNASAVYLSCSLSGEELVSKISTAISSISEYTEESMDYFEKYHMYDIEYDDEKTGTGYTTALTTYGDAYIYMNPTGTYQDILTLSHEFGHFNTDFFTETSSLFTIGSVDVLEINSQGLEMLLYDKYESMVPGYGKAMQSYELYSLVNTIMVSFIADEFEYTVFTTDGLTVDDLDEIEESIAEEYGMNAEGWYYRPHYMECPAYMIGYATSGLAALELFIESQTDYDSAVDKYIQLSAISNTSSYREAMAETGFSDIFDAGTIKDLVNEFYKVSGISSTYYITR